MKSVKSANILSVRTGLSSKALSISGHLNGEVFLCNYAISVNVCNGNLCSWNHIELVQPYIIHLLALIGKLSCGKRRRLIYNQWRLYFQISVFNISIQEK